MFAVVFATWCPPIRLDQKLGTSSRTVDRGVYEAAASSRLNAFDRYASMSCTLIGREYR